jgi:hypothetical protein
MAVQCPFQEEQAIASLESASQQKGPQMIDGLPVVPAPAKANTLVMMDEKVDTEGVPRMMMETPWFRERIWFFDDGAYATGSPSKKVGIWSVQGRLLRLDSNQGGRQLFSYQDEMWLGEEKFPTRLIADEQAKLLKP